MIVDALEGEREGGGREGEREGGGGEREGGRDREGEREGGREGCKLVNKASE